MSRLIALSLSMLLLLAAFPLISLGTTQGPPLLWQVGLVALTLGGAIPPVRRFLASKEPEPPPSHAGMADDERV